MDIDVIKRLIKKYSANHIKFVIDTQTAKRYYNNKNDILRIGLKTEEESVLRNADNRISTNFYGLLVRQKAAYMFSYPPIIDIGETELNKKIYDLLGDRYGKICKDLCVNAANSGVAWLHIWKNEKGLFEYGVVDSEQIIPIWTSDLTNELLAVFRTYTQMDDNGDLYRIYEYWSEEECYAFKHKESDGIEQLIAYDVFSIFNGGFASEYTNVYRHDLGGVPFIPFFNNSEKTSDLDNVKGLIDSYDKVFNGFLNDLEDIQELIFILKGYEGQDLNTFLSELRKYKTVTLDGLDGSGLETLAINIPVEARKEMLQICRKAIFEQGQGVDPDPQNFGNSSGVALKFLYSLLELKAGITETEFRIGLSKLVNFMGNYLGINVENVNQTWTRNAITNDSELADICSKGSGVVSKLTILKNHPFVEDADKELEQLEEEKQEALEQFGESLFDESFKLADGKAVAGNGEKGKDDKKNKQ